MQSGKSLTNTIKSTGPRTVPCGMPLPTGVQSETLPLTTTRCFLPVRNERSHSRSSPLTPMSWSFWRSRRWGTESKARLKSSRRRPPVHLPPSDDALQMMRFGFIKMMNPKRKFILLRLITRCKFLDQLSCLTSGNGGLLAQNLTFLVIHHSQILHITITISITFFSLTSISHESWWQVSIKSNQHNKVKPNQINKLNPAARTMLKI